MAKDVRKITGNVISAVEDGFLSWETVAKAALKYMSEDDVADMAQSNDWALFPDKDEKICPECGEELGEDGRCYNPDCDQYDPLSQYFDDEDEIELIEEDLASNEAKALDEVRTAMQRLDEATFGDIVEENDEYTFEVRYWGDWVISDDHRNDPEVEDDDLEDWDWKELAGAWQKKLNMIIADVNKKYNVKVIWQAGEKNWLYISVRKQALAESQSQEIGNTYRNLSKYYGVDLNELVYGPKGFMATKYPDGFDVSADIIYLEDKWDEFEQWMKEKHGIDFEAIREKNLEETLDEAAGGIALGMTVEDIAEKHGVAVDDIEKQIKIGVEIEQEHTSDEEQAKKIAMDHLVEFPDYYDRLVKMEKEAEAELGTATDETEALEEAFDIDVIKKKAKQYVEEKGFGYDFAVDDREVARAINFMTLLYATEEALETDVWFNQYNISDGFATLASPRSFTSKYNEKQLSLWKENKVELQKLAKQLNGNIELITLSNGDKQVVLDVGYSKGEEKELREESFSENDLEEALNYDKLNFRGLTGHHELEYEDVPVVNQFDEDMEIDYTLDIEISQEMVIDFICEYYILARDILTMEEAQMFIDKAAKEDREAFEEYLLDMFYEEAQEAAQDYILDDYVEGYGPNKYKVKIKEEEDEEEIANLTEAITTKQEIDGIVVDINEYDLDLRHDKVTAYMTMCVSDDDQEDQEVWLRLEYNDVLQNAEFEWEPDGPATYVPYGSQRVLFDDGKGGVESVDIGELEPDEEVYETIDETVLSVEDVLNILKIDKEQLTKLEKAARKIANKYLKPIIEEELKDDAYFWPYKDE